MAEEELDALRELARRLRIHYEVNPEVVLRRGRRIKVGFEIHLWAVHDKGARCRDARSASPWSRS